MQNTVNFSRNSEYSIVPNSGISVIPYQQNQVKNAPNGKVYSNRFIDEHIGSYKSSPNAPPGWDEHIGSYKSSPNALPGWDEHIGSYKSSPNALPGWDEHVSEERINLTPSELEDLRKKALGGKKTHANVYTQTYTSYVNIDSSQRVRFPENNYEQKLYNLPPYPLLFTNGSSIVTVNLPEHPFIKNDRIILDGVISKNLFLENVITVKKNSLFVRILHSHHGLSLFGLYDETNPSEFEPIEYVDLLPASYNQFDNIPDTGTQYYILKKNITIDLTIKISGVRGTTIGNIPVNYLNRKQTVYLLFTKVSATKFAPDKNSYLIKLLRKSNINYKDGINGTNRILITYYNLFGIPLNYINSGTPVNEKHKFPYLVVTSATLNTFDVDVGYKAIIDISDPTYTFYYYTDFADGICPDIDVNTLVFGRRGGGALCYTRRILDVIPGFPNPNNYLIRLDKSYKNVVQATIISSIFPNSQRIINNIPPDNVNNRLYWRNLDEGNFIYVLEATPGNYSALELQIELEKIFNRTIRYPYSLEFFVDPNPEFIINATPFDNELYDSFGNYKYNIVKVNINTTTDIVSFASFKRIQQQDTLLQKILIIPDYYILFTAAENFQINFGSTGTEIVPQNINPFVPSLEKLFIYFTNNTHIRIPFNYVYATGRLYEYVKFIPPYTSTTHGTNSFVAGLNIRTAILVNFYRTKSIFNNTVSEQELNSINTTTILQNFNFEYINEIVTIQNHNLTIGDLIITDQFVYPSISNKIFVYEIIKIIDSESFIVKRIEHGETYKFIYDGIIINFSPDADLVTDKMYYWQDQILPTDPVLPINTQGNNNTLSFTAIEPTNENKIIMFVYQPNNALNVGDIIDICGSEAINNVPCDIINGCHPIIEIIDENNYVVSIEKTIPFVTLSPPPVNTVTITYPDLFQMLFNYADTLGDILSFRRVSQPGSITPYVHTVRNIDPYANDFDYLSLGNDYLERRLKKLDMTGPDYFYVVIPELGLYKNTRPVDNVFAKIQWGNDLTMTDDCCNKTMVVYNTFVPTVSVFDNPISVLYELNVSIRQPDGRLVEFNGLDHSFTIAIVEVYNQPDETDINVRIDSEMIVRRTG